jgi:hypothetical protein
MASKLVCTITSAIGCTSAFVITVSGPGITPGWRQPLGLLAVFAGITFLPEQLIKNAIRPLHSRSATSRNMSEAARAGRAVGTEGRGTEGSRRTLQDPDENYIYSIALFNAYYRSKCLTLCIDISRNPRRLWSQYGRDADFGQRSRFDSGLSKAGATRRFSTARSLEWIKSHASLCFSPRQKMYERCVRP